MRDEEPDVRARFAQVSVRQRDDQRHHGPHHRRVQRGVDGAKRAEPGADSRNQLDVARPHSPERVHGQPESEADQPSDERGFEGRETVDGRQDERRSGGAQRQQVRDATAMEVERTGDDSHTDRDSVIGGHDHSAFTPGLGRAYEP